MSKSVRLALAACMFMGCGDDAPATPDSYAGNHPPPRVIPGGGIGDGAIDGVVNLYVIDDATRTPISGAAVKVGDLEGSTDATGLFVADGLVGPQTVLAKAASYRAEMWLGANGANMTMSLKPAADPTPASGRLSGSITGFSAITVPAGHHKTAIVSYSNDDKASDAANNLTTTANANICDTALPAGGCTYSIVTRTGTVALLAAVFDHDTLNDANPNNDTFTLIGWAARTGIAVAGDSTGIDLAIVDVGNLGNVTVDLGTPPSGMPNVAAVVGIEVGASGTMQLAPQFVTPTMLTVLAPRLAAFSGSSYRLTGIANNGSSPTAASSVVLHRGLMTTSLAAGTWLGVPSSLEVTRTGATWTAVAGAVVSSVEYDLDKTNHLLSVTSFDGSTSFTIPDMIALPASGPIVARSTSLQGTLDVTSFSIDADLAKITGFAAQPVQIN